MKAPFIFMGHDKNSYYFIPHNQNIALEIRRGNTSLKNNLEEIAPLSFWLEHFMEETKQGPKINYDRALDYVRSESHKRGIYDDSALLGVGPHLDENNEIIINTGRSLQLYGNGEIEYNDYKGELAFVRSRHRFVIDGKAWTKKERKSFLEQVDTFGFEEAIQKICLIGWCVTAPFASLFDFRPHIWVTARKGTGKSHLMENILEPAIGPFLTKVEGLSTEASIRQATGKDCRPTLIDEFDANNKHDQTLINKVMSLARSAYGGGEIIKGTPSHNAVVFKTKMTFCFSSVKVYFVSAADRSRVVVINMKESPGKMTGAPKMQGLRKMMFDRLFDLIENIRLVKEEILKMGFSERLGDTYAPLIAGYWMIISDKLFMQDAKFNARMGEILKQISNNETAEDEDSVVDYILSHRVRLDTGETKTIAEMLTEMEDGTLGKLKYDKEIRRLGIRRFEKTIDGEDCEVLAISTSNQNVSKIVEDTAFFKYKDILSRHEAFLHSDEKYPAVYMAGKAERAILLDWAMLEEKYMRVPSGEDGIPF